MRDNKILEKVSTLGVVRFDFINKMFDRQMELLKLYKRDNKMESPSVGKIDSCIFREYAELLDETGALWHYYANDKTMNNEQALFELVDVCHFIVLKCVCQFKGEKISESFENIKEQPCSPEFVSDPLKISSRVFGHLFDIGGDLNGTILLMINLVGIWLNILGYTQDQFEEAYTIKSELNKKRASYGDQYAVLKAEEKSLKLSRKKTLLNQLEGEF